MQREEIRPLPVSGLAIGVVVARFNDLITSRLLTGALDALERLGVYSVRVLTAPGAFELPLMSQKLCESGVDGVIALGAVIRGQTDHYEHVAGSAASGIMTVSLTCGIPVGFGVLTCETLEQALDRAGGKAGNKGAETAQAVVEAVQVLRRLKERPAPTA